MAPPKFIVIDGGSGEEIFRVTQGIGFSHVREGQLISHETEAGVTKTYKVESTLWKLRETEMNALAEVIWASAEIHVTVVEVV